MPSTDPPSSFFIVSGVGICFMTVTPALLVDGADRSSALVLGLIAAILGGAFSWFWATRA